MTENNSDTRNQTTVSFARQAIFDMDRRLWGFELFCIGNSESSPSGFSPDENIAINIAQSAGIGIKQITTRKKRIVVNLSEKSILDDQVYILPPEHTTILVSEDVFRNDSVPERITLLRQDGFQISVSEFTNSDDCATLYSLADMVVIDVSRFSSTELMDLISVAKTYNAIPMAKMVEDGDLFAKSRELGFHLFQGAFSKAAEIIPMRKLSPNETARFQLLQVMEAPDPDLKLLADRIQSDAAISFKLLSYMNSASFAFAQKISSISHAVNMLGWNKIKSWLRVVLLSDMGQSDESCELLRTSTQRGKFLELMAIKFPFWGFEPDKMHMLGLFSLLDSMIGMPMDEVVSFLPLDDKLKAALCRNPDSEYLPLLVLAQNMEEGHWPQTQTMIQQLNLDDQETKNAFIEAVEWSEDLNTLIDLG